MIRNWILIALVGLSLVLLSFASASSQVLNGSFEHGPILGGSPSAPERSGSRRIEGWLVTREEIDYTETEWVASDGAHSIDLEGSPGFGGVQQSLSTVPGRQYLVSFDLAGNPCSFTGPGIKRMAVTAANQTQEFSFSTFGRSATNMGWTRKEWTFNAVDEVTDIEFYSLEGNWCGAAIDNVSVVLVWPQFLRGDCNGDGEIGGTADPVFLLGFQFLGTKAPGCLAACDANGDGIVGGQVTDALYLLTYNFLGGSPPPPPFPACGPSELASDERFGCENSPKSCQ